ncbi:hypothetical protein KAK06_14085 [Ideonella sp. 4Y11]|uniref:HAF repeat-containing protein n=1 Tax=Ideonella aquatica TaxID=2824119 RepID=A0A940YLI4_9BURK|nr:hypothetical protein [Ideonella aquatica]MBQ0960079.1 hypothetical protein [Ideonella aquatica]
MAALAGVVNAAAAAALRYELVDLAASSEVHQSSATAINNTDKVVGYTVLRSNRNQQPVRFIDGRAQRLVQRTDQPYRGGVAEAISDAGHVAGNLDVYGTDFPVFVTLGGVTTLYRPPAGNAVARGVNSLGEVAGSRSTIGQATRAFVMRDGQWTDLPVPQPGLPSEAWAINDAGQVVGHHSRSVDGMEVQLGALWQDGELKESFGLAGSRYTRALAVNRQGWVTGYSQAGRHMSWDHAYIHRDGVTTDLETHLGARSYGYGINAAGEVVGDRVAGNHAGPFLYSDGKMRWLAQLLPAAQQAQWRLVSVHAINDAGHVVGLAVNIAQDKLKAVMLRRLPDQGAAP